MAAGVGIFGWANEPKHGMGHPKPAQNGCVFACEPD